MPSSLDRLESEVLDLPAHERARLAHRLIVSLENEPGDDPVRVEQAWEQEIRQRLEAYRSGRVQSIPASEVFAQARDNLRE